MTLVDITSEALKFLCIVTIAAPFWVAVKAHEGMSEPQFQGQPAFIWWLFAALMLGLAPALAVFAYVYKLATLGATYLGAGDTYSQSFDGSFLLVVVPCCFYGIVRAMMRTERLGRRLDAWSGVHGYRGLDTAISLVCGVGCAAATVQIAKTVFGEKKK